jgi:hypothetical protein
VARNREFTDMSQLEQEFELEMEDDDEREAADATDEEFEDLPVEGESPDDDEHELGDDPGESTDYAERLHELSLREYESESEIDGALGDVLTEMEHEFFLGKLRSGWNRFKKKGIGKLVNKAMKMAAGKIPAFQALSGITRLARGDLKGMIGSLAKAGIGAAIPGGGVALDALKGLGFGEGELADDNRPAWEGVVSVAREAYEHLANNITERADEPLEASRVASDAFRTALQKQRSGGAPQARRVGARGPAGQRKRRIRLRRGDILIVHCD